MFFAAYPKQADGTAGARPAEFFVAGKCTTVFATLPELEAALQESVGSEGAADYLISPCDEQGLRLEKVADADAQDAARDANWLVQADENIRLAMACMLAGRQLYVSGVSALEELLAATTVKETAAQAPDQLPKPAHTPHVLTAELLIRSIAEQAAKPFNQLDLLSGLASSVLPWLKGRAGAAALADREARMQEARDREAARRAVEIPLGGDSPRPRGKPLVLVGYAPHTQALLRHAIRVAAAAEAQALPAGRFTVVHLLSQGAAPLSGLAENYVPVPFAEWSGCTRSGRTLSVFFNQKLGPRLKSYPDLLVVDDLAAAADGLALPGQQQVGYAPFRAGTAAVHLTVTARAMGFAVLAAVPCPDEKPRDLVAAMGEKERAELVTEGVQVASVSARSELSTVTGKSLVRLTAADLSVTAEAASLVDSRLLV